MAEATTEEIVTRFTADLTDLELGIAKAGASLKKYEDYAGGAAASGNQLNSNLGSLTAKTIALEGVQRKVVATTKEEAAALSGVSASMRSVNTEQAKMGDVSGFVDAGKAADAEGQKIDALIERINQLRAAHAAAGTVEAQGPIAADIGTAQMELASIPIPQGAGNAAEIAAALAPLQAIQEQAPAAAIAVDQAIADINNDLKNVGQGSPEELEKLRLEALATVEAVGGISEAEKEVLANAVNVIAEYERIRATGEQFPGQLEKVKAEAAGLVTQLTGVTQEELDAAAAGEKFAGTFERSAKGAQSTGAKVASLRQQVRQAQAEAANLAVRFGEFSPQAIEAAKKAALLKEELSDINATIDAFNPEEKFRVFTQLGSNVAGGLTAVQGALTAIGVDGETATEALAKVQGLLAVTQGLNAFAGIGDSLKNFTKLLRAGQVAQVAATATTEVDTVAKGANATATGAAATATGGLTSAVGALKAAILANPLLAAAAAIAAIGLAIAATAEDTRDWNAELEDLKTKLDEVTSTNAQRFDLSKRLRDAQDEAQKLQGKITERQAIELRGVNEIATLRGKQQDAQLNFEEVSRTAAEISLQEETEETRKALDEANKLRREYAEQVRSYETEIKIAQQTTANELTSLTAREKDLAVKAAKERAQKIASTQKEAIELQRNISETVLSLEQEEIRRGLSARDQQSFDIDRRYDELVAKAADSFAKLRKLAGEGTPGADTAAIASINTKQKEVEAQINAAREAEQKVATQKAIAEEIGLRTEANARITEVINAGTNSQLNELRSRIDAGQALTAEDQERYLSLIAEVNAAEIRAAQDKYAKLLEDNAKFNSDMLGLTDDGKKNEAALIAQRDAEITASNAEAEAARNAQTSALMQERIGILAASAEQGIAILAQAGAEGQLNSEAVAKQLIVLLLDTVEKIVLMNTAAAATGAIASNAATPVVGVAKGIAEAALVTALIKGIFAAVKATIQGAYTGEDYIGGTPMWSGRDGHLRRVHTGERIVTAKTNAQHYDLFQAAENGDLQNYLNASYVMPAINAYLESDDGRRVSTSIMVPKYHDANVVRGLKANADKTDRTNELLYALLKKEPRVVTPGRRSWN